MLIFLFSFSSTISGKLSKRAVLFSRLFFIALFILASIRDETGTDFKTYTNIWYGINSLNAGYDSIGYGHLEPGFRILVSILKFVSTDSIFFFFTMSFLTLLILYLGLIKVPDLNIHIAMLVFFSIFYIPYVFNGMRQALAMSIFVYSLPFIMNRSFLKVLVLTILSSSFHISGIIIMISYVIYYYKPDLVLFSIVGTFLSLILYNLKIAPPFLNYLSDGKFELYKNIWGDSSYIQVLLRSLLTIFILAISYVIKKNYFNKLVMIYLVGYFFYIATQDAYMIAARVNMFFRVLEVVLFAVAMNHIRQLNIRLLIFAFVVLITSYTLYLNMQIEENIYKTVFQ